MRKLTIERWVTLESGMDEEMSKGNTKDIITSEKVVDTRRSSAMKGAFAKMSMDVARRGLHWWGGKGNDGDAVDTGSSTEAATSLKALIMR